MDSTDTLPCVTWLGANGVLSFCAVRISRAAFSGNRPSCKALSAVTIFIGCVLLTATALGALGFLHAGALLIGAPTMAALFGFALPRCACVDRTTSAASQRPLLFAAAEGAARIGETFASAARFRPWATLLCAILAALALSNVIMHGLLPFPSEWDCLAYHSPLIDQWLRARSLYVPDSPQWWLPGNSELIGLWFTGVFSGDFLASLNNVPAALLWGLGTAALVRELGFPTAWSNVTVLASLCVGVALDQVTNTSNDLAVVAFFTGGAAYALRFLSNNRPVDLALCAALVGMLAGVKYFALGYAAILVCALTALVTAMWGPGIGLRTLAVAAGGFVTFGGYWYVRNALVSGSAIFPMGFGQGRPEMLYPDTWSTTFAGNGSPELLGLWLDALWRFGGPCHWVAFVCSPVCLWWLIDSGARAWGKGHRDDALRRLFLASLLAGSAAVLAVIPFLVEDIPGTLNHMRWGYTPFRYGLCFVSVLILAFALCLRDIGDGIHRLVSRRDIGMITATAQDGGGWRGARTRTMRRRVLEHAPFGCFAAAVAAQLVGRIWDAGSKYGSSGTDTALLALNILLFGCDLWLAWRILGGGRRVSWAFAIASLCVVITCATQLSARWHQGFAKHYDRVYRTELFEELESTDASTLHLCVLADQCYPFFGSRRQCRVMAPRLATSAEALLGYLTENGATHVIIQTEPVDRWQSVSRWVTEQHSAFTPLRVGPKLGMYRFNPHSRRGGAANRDEASPAQAFGDTP